MTTQKNKKDYFTYNYNLNFTVAEFLLLISNSNLLSTRK